MVSAQWPTARRQPPQGAQGRHVLMICRLFLVDCKTAFTAEAHRSKLRMAYVTSDAVPAGHRILRELTTYKS